MHQPIRQEDKLDEVDEEAYYEIEHFVHKHQPRKQHAKDKKDKKKRHRKDRSYRQQDFESRFYANRPTQLTANDKAAIYEETLASSRQLQEIFSERRKEAMSWAESHCKVPQLTEKQIFNLKPRISSQFCFHPFQNLLYTAARSNRSTAIQVWDASRVESALNTFTNVPKTSKQSSRSLDVSSLLVVNEFYTPVLA